MLKIILTKEKIDLFVFYITSSYEIINSLDKINIITPSNTTSNITFGIDIDKKTREYNYVENGIVCSDSSQIRVSKLWEIGKLICRLEKI